MRIDHVAIWTKNIERLKSFYEWYFHAVPGEKYKNPDKQFESCFLSFSSGARLELMQTPSIHETLNPREAQLTGFTHLAISTGSTEGVDELTARLRADGYEIKDGPRWTGDGYYESVVLDPDGNRVEITV